MKYDFTYLSLGAGVQSTAMLIMSALGLQGCPKADVAIFADTGDEPAWLYDHLETLKKWSSIPIQGHFLWPVDRKLGGAAYALAGFALVVSMPHLADGYGMLGLHWWECWSLA